MFARNNLGSADAMVEQGNRPGDLFGSPANLSSLILCLQTERSVSQEHAKLGKVCGNVLNPFKYKLKFKKIYI